MMTSGHLERESLLALVERDPIEASTCPIALLFVPSVVLNLLLLDFLYLRRGGCHNKSSHDPHSSERAHLTMVGGSNQSAVEGSFKCTWVSKWWELYRGILLHINLCCANSKKEKILKKTTKPTLSCKSFCNSASWALISLSISSGVFFTW